MEEARQRRALTHYVERKRTIVQIQQRHPPFGWSRHLRLRRGCDGSDHVERELGVALREAVRRDVAVESVPVRDGDAHVEDRASSLAWVRRREGTDPRCLARSWSRTAPPARRAERSPAPGRRPRGSAPRRRRHALPPGARCETQPRLARVRPAALAGLSSGMAATLASRTREYVLDRDCHDGLQELLLAPEVMVDPCEADVGLRRDIAHRGAEVSASGEALQRRRMTDARESPVAGSRSRAAFGRAAIFGVTHAFTLSRSPANASPSRA